MTNGGFFISAAFFKFYFSFPLYNVINRRGTAAVKKQKSKKDFFGRMAFLRIANLKKSYRVSKTDYQEVLKGINVEFKRGELVAILGESGCGKSTLMNILGGLDNDYTGSIILEDEFFKDYTEKQLDDYRKSTVGMIFQNYNLINHMTISENVEIAMTMNDISRDRRKKRARALLKQMGLADYVDKYPNQLSGGQRQRVSIARALANAPGIILADEPTGALDKDSAQQVMNILKRIAQSGRLVIIVTHSQKVADECSRVLEIDDGVIKSDTRKYTLNYKAKPLGILRSQDIRFADLYAIAFANLITVCLSGGITDYVNENLANTANALQLQVRTESYFTTSELNTFTSISGVDYLVKSSYVRLNATYRYGTDEGYIMMLNSSYDELGDSLTYEAGGVCEDGEENQLLISDSFADNLYTKKITTAEELVGTDITLVFSGVETAFTICGVYEDASAYAGYPCAYVTDTAMQALYDAADKNYAVNAVYVYVEDTSYISAVSSTIEALGYSVSREDSTVETLLEYIVLGTLVRTCFSGISIVVSAIMIFIVTYISVIERTKEIGILRAVGGRKKDVALLFVTESGILGAGAGLIAVAFTLFISLTANLVLDSYIGCWILSLNVIAYLVGLVLSVGISVASGLLPALQAAKLDPAESLMSD